MGWLFGDPDEQEALTTGSAWGPLNKEALPDPAKLAAAQRMAGRLNLSRQLASGATAVSEANRKGGNFFDLLAAAAGGMSGGADEFQKSRAARGQADIYAKHAAGQMTGGTMGKGQGGGTSGKMVRLTNGLVVEVMVDGSFKRAPYEYQHATGIPQLDANQEAMLIGNRGKPGAGVVPGPAGAPGGTTPTGSPDTRPRPGGTAAPTGTPGGTTPTAPAEASPYQVNQTRTMPDGTVWRFKGGDWRKPASWEQVS